MSLVVRAQLRFLWRARGSMLSALLGMTVGVASVVGVHLLSAQIAARVAQQSQPVGDVDLYLQRAELDEEDYFRLRARWRDGDMPEVAALFPLLEGEVTVGDESYLLVGTDPFAVGPLQFAADDRYSGSGSAEGSSDTPLGFAAFLMSDSVLLPNSLRDFSGLMQQPATSTARQSGRVLLRGRLVEVLGYSAPDRVILADLPTAQAILASEVEGSSSPAASGPHRRLNRIGVRLTGESTSANRSTRFGNLVRQLFPGAFAEPAASALSQLDASWQQIPAASQDPTQQLLRSVLFNVAALSVLALVVAWLLTYQVACHALGRRQSMFVRLQSLGVSRRRLRWLTQLEGVVLGLLATLSGVVLGFLLANLLLSLALGDSFRFALSLSGFVWLKALVSGVGVAAVSYWLAVDQALPAMTKTVNAGPVPSSFPQASAALRRRVMRFGQALVLLLVFSWGLWGGTLVGAFACIVVAALCLIIYLPALARWLWRMTLTPAVNLRGSTLRILGIRQVLLGRELRLGVSALALALATALGISIMVDSFRGAFLAMLDQRLADDVVLQLKPPLERVATASETLTLQLDRALLEEQVRPLIQSGFWRGVVPVSVQGVAGRLEFADNFPELLARFGSKPGSPESGAGAVASKVFVNESFARLRSLAVGQPVQLQGARSAGAAIVGGIFTDFGELRPRILAPVELVRELHGASPLDELYVRSGDLSAVRLALADALEQSQLVLRDQSQIRRRSVEIFEQTFAITRALTWLALLVAALALANALAAHGLQQQGVARQLHVLGLSASDQRRLQISRTGYVGGVSVLLALPLGLLIAALLCYAVNPRAFGWSFAMQLTPAGLGWPLLGGAFGALLAAGFGEWLARRQTRDSPQMPGQLGRATTSGAVTCLAVLLVFSLLGGCSAEQEHESAPAQGAAPALRVGALLGGEAQGFARATRIVPFEFPRDHGAHPAYRSEWWYLTCPLTAVAGGDEYGVQFTLFRQALTPLPVQAPNTEVPQTFSNSSGWRTGQVYMAHAALSDVSAGRHFEDSRLTRGHPRLAGVVADPFAVWLEGWRLAEVAPDSAATDLSLATWRLQVDAAGFSIDLQLLQEKAVVLQGDRGLSYKGSREASYYYSVPRLRATGVVRPLKAGHRPETSVVGACWFDREWSTSVLADDLVGWDWFALQFNDATELMLFQLRSAQPGNPGTGELPPATRRQGKRVAADGSSFSVPASQLHFQPLRFWRDETGALWPVEWAVQIQDRRLRIVAALDDQRMRSSVDYWEGLVWVFENELRIGQGYLEMTGYAP